MKARRTVLTLATLALTLSALLALSGLGLAEHKPNHNPGGGGGDQPFATGRACFLPCSTNGIQDIVGVDVNFPGCVTGLVGGLENVFDTALNGAATLTFDGVIAAALLSHDSATYDLFFPEAVNDGTVTLTGELTIRVDPRCELPDGTFVETTQWRFIWTGPDGDTLRIIVAYEPYPACLRPVPIGPFPEDATVEFCDLPFRLDGNFWRNREKLKGRKDLVILCAYEECGSTSFRIETETEL